MRELRGEMERLRSEREEWEAEAGRERERREEAEEELRAIEWREREGRKEWEEGRDQLERERERADNLQEVLGEFQAGQSFFRDWSHLLNRCSERIRTTTSYF
jgi:chromosome segregation ATPase